MLGHRPAAGKGVAVTEAEWLGCTEPGPMREDLRGKISDRKLRLFDCTCCRRLWHRMTDDRTRAAVEAAERYADGAARAGELAQACEEAWAAAPGPAPVSGSTAYRLVPSPASVAAATA